MGLVYVYMAAWIAGGVLLGSNMLLEHPVADSAAIEQSHDGLVRPRARSWGLHLLALALIGFGLGGLVAEGVALVASPWTAACGLLGASLLAAGGYLARGAKRG